MHGHYETDPSVRTPLPVYDIHQDYDWNYAYAPKLSMESIDSMDPARTVDLCRVVGSLSIGHGGGPASQ